MAQWQQLRRVYTRAASHANKSILGPGWPQAYRSSVRQKLGCTVQPALHCMKIEDERDRRDDSSTCTFILGPITNIQACNVKSDIKDSKYHPYHLLHLKHPAVRGYSPDFVSTIYHLFARGLGRTFWSGG